MLRHKGNPPRWLTRPLKYYGYVVRRIFGYGTMDEVLCPLSYGMFLAESKEMFAGTDKAFTGPVAESKRN